MKFQRQSFHWQNDYERVQEFLRETFKINKTLHNWIPTRFENIKFGPCGKEIYSSKDDINIQIWEEKSRKDSKPKIIAVTIHRPPFLWTINIHPNFRSIEEEIIKWIENTIHERQIDSSTEHQIDFLVQETDSFRKELLQKRNYQDQGLVEIDRIRPLNKPIPEPIVPEGFEIRSVNIIKEFQKYQEAQATVFPHCKYMTMEQAEIYKSASFYNPKLDLAVIAPNGQIAAFTTIRIDPISKISEFEPVGTHPNYRRKGLAKAIIYFGLQLLEKNNLALISIPGSVAREEVIRLYDSVGFTDKVNVHLWQKKV
jgi:GNAT superfamily N-acetyltransferase